MIVILMTSRTGSSLVAKIFHEHGFDCGPYPFNQHGYWTYENQDIKAWTNDHKRQMRYRAGQFVKPVPGIEEVIPENACCKIGVEFWPLFKPFNPHVVTVKRHLEMAVKSTAEKADGTVEQARRNILARYELLDIARAEADGVEVWTDELVEGDFSSLRSAFKKFDLPFDEQLARSCVNPEKWHYRAA